MQFVRRQKTEENPLRSSVSGLLSIPIESMQLVFISTKIAVELKRLTMLYGIVYLTT